MLSDIDTCLLIHSNVTDMKITMRIISFSNNLKSMVGLRDLWLQCRFVFQRQVSELLYQAAAGATYTSVCGVPYTALPLATVSTLVIYILITCAAVALW